MSLVSGHHISPQTISPVTRPDETEHSVHFKTSHSQSLYQVTIQGRNNESINPLKREVGVSPSSNGHHTYQQCEQVTQGMDNYINQSISQPANK